MKQTMFLLAGIAMGAVLSTAAFTTLARVKTVQDPVTLTPQYYKVLLENDTVRVFDFRLKPGEKEQMHSHPASIVYVIDDSQIKFTYPDGHTEDAVLSAGKVAWRGPVTHRGENIGTSDAHGLVIELKKTCN